MKYMLLIQQGDTPTPRSPEASRQANNPTELRVCARRCRGYATH
jgi:hypothetical protein